MPEITDPRLLSELNGGQQPGYRPIQISGPDSFKVSAERRAEEDQRFQLEQLELSRRNASRQDRRDAIASQKDLRDIEAKDFERSEKGFDNEMGLRKEFGNIPIAKAYPAVLPAYASALKSAPNPAGDLQLLYAVAKVWDPESVVREGEQAMISNTQNFVDKIAAQYGKQVLGGGTFTETARQNLRKELQTRMSQLNQAFIGERVRFKELASNYGIDPVRIVGDHPGKRFQSVEAEWQGKPVTQADYSGNILPTQGEDDVTPPSGGVQASPQARGTGYNPGGGKPSIAKGGTGRDRIPAPMLAEYRQWVGSRRPADIDPQDYAMFRMGLDRKYGYGLRDDTFSTYMKEAQGIKSGKTNPMSPILEAPREVGALEQARNYVMNSAGGGAAAGFTNAAGLGIPSLLNTDGYNQVREESPIATTLAEIGGGVTGTGLLAKGAMAARPTLGAAKAVAGANIGYGGVYGATQMPDNPLLGAAVGAGAGAAGDVIGRTAIAPLIGAFGRTQAGVRVGDLINRTAAKTRLIGGRSPLSQSPQISPAEAAIGSRTQGQGLAIANQIDEAERFGIPYTLADANPELRSLAGASIRRSPTVAGGAEEFLDQRSRGQFDRAMGAVNRDFGPVGNVPQMSDDLITQARTASAPLYDEAFAAPGASSVDISGIAKTPIGQRGLSRAGDNVRNTLGPDGQPLDPMSLGFDFNDAGDTVLGKTPSFETLDYFKRGLDDVIEGGYDPLARSYSPDARAAQGMKNRLVSQIDEVNPAYAAARQAYAGPAQARTAMRAGESGMSPSVSADEFAFDLKNYTGANLDQFKLGQRGAIANQMANARYSSNPFEVAYGGPRNQQKLAATYPDGVEQFGRQYEMERQIARNANDLIGNSKTAQRAITDQEFGISPGAGFALDAAGMAATGAPPMATMARLGLKAKDAVALGMGRKKAEALGPMLLDPNFAKETLKTVRKKRMLGNKARRKAQRTGAAIGGALAVPIVTGPLQ